MGGGVQRAHAGDSETTGLVCGTVANSSGVGAAFAAPIKAGTAVVGNGGEEMATDDGKGIPRHDVPASH
jgi:hypothetical protein